MKIQTLLLIWVALFFTVSCDKNDDPKPDSNPAQEIAGNYKGYSISEFMYSSTPMITPDESITITANEDETAIIVFDSGVWGKFNIQSAKISLVGNEYKIEGSGKAVMGMDPDSQKEYDCTVEGSISKDKKTVSIVFEIPSVMGGVKLTFLLGDPPASMVIAGVYNGELALSVGDNNYDPVEGFKVTIKSQDDGKAEISLPGFGVGSMAFQEMVMKDVEVGQQADGSYSLSGDINTLSGTTNVTGTLEGTINKEGEAIITFSLKPGAMPMPITAVFTGK